MNIESFLFQSKLAAKSIGSGAALPHTEVGNFTSVIYVPVFEEFQRVLSSHGYQKRITSKKTPVNEARPATEPIRTAVDVDLDLERNTTMQTIDRPKTIKIASHLPIASSHPGRRSVSSSNSGHERPLDPPTSEDWNWMLQEPRIRDIPCAVVSGGQEPGSKGREKVLIYFHANAEDILIISQNMETHASYLGVHGWVTQDDSDFG